MLKYDSVFNPPSHYFHLEIDWIISTGCVVDDFIANMQRKAKMAGVTVQQIPIDKTSNPFTAPIRVSLFSKFVPMLKNQLFVFQLVSKFDFISEPDDGFIHKNGFAFLNCTDNGFLW